MSDQDSAQDPCRPERDAREYLFVFRADGCLLVSSGEDDDLEQAVAHGPDVADNAPPTFVDTWRGTTCLALWGREEAPDGYEYRSLRELLGVLRPDVASLATRARQLLEWDRNHRYCGRCGTPTQDKAGERAKVCPACGHTAFPRINPAIIVAVVHEGRLLLARNRRFRNNMHSIIAGFVEAGETLEQTVHREIAEEVSIRVRDVRYVKSQAWPFPNTLMLGFMARYEGGDIQVDGDEIVEAGWFDRTNLPPIPKHGSLSRELIEDVLGPLPSD